jgi:hypothetical protein
MESGSPLSVGPLTEGQVYYDGIVAHSNCSGASDTLDCLRKLPYDTFKAAIDTSPSILSYQVSNKELMSVRVVITQVISGIEVGMGSPSRWYFRYRKSSKSR